MSQAGKKIWLIGASEGIGRELAIKLAKERALLVLSARNEERLNTLISELEGEGHIAAKADVTNYESLKEAYQKADVVDTVIYNAGVYTPMEAADINLETIEKTFDINLHGAFRTLNLITDDFVSRKYGHIVIVASVAGYQGLPASYAYGVSKAALIHTAEALKIDLDKHGVKVQVVNPGFVETRLTNKNDFDMPAIISATKAADEIYKGMNSNNFEIHFPKRFTRFLKFLSILPYSIYFWLMKKIKI